MRFSKELHDKYVILSLDEEKLTSRISPDLKGEFVVIEAGGNSNVLVDLGKVKYADSSGLSSLLSARRLFNGKGGLFVLFNLQEHVEKLIKISQLDRVLDIVPTRQEAIEATFMHEIGKDIDDDEEE